MSRTRRCRLVASRRTSRLSCSSRRHIPWFRKWCASTRRSHRNNMILGGGWRVLGTTLAPSLRCFLIQTCALSASTAKKQSPRAKTSKERLSECTPKKWAKTWLGERVLTVTGSKSSRHSIMMTSSWGERRRRQAPHLARSHRHHLREAKKRSKL